MSNQINSLSGSALLAVVAKWLGLGAAIGYKAAMPLIPDRQIIRVLLIDDEEPIHDQLKQVLAQPSPFDFEVISAKSLHEAGNLLMHKTPDIILMDLRLNPHAEDSIEDTLYTLPRYANSYPVAMLTGYGTADLWDRCSKAGALDCLPKESFLKPKYSEFLIHTLVNAIINFRNRPNAA